MQSSDSLELLESKHIEIDGHHGADAQKAFYRGDIEAVLTVTCEQ